MNPSTRPLFLATAVALFFAFSLALIAQQPAPPVKAADDPPVPPATAATDDPAAKATAPDATELRRLDVPVDQASETRQTRGQNVRERVERARERAAERRTNRTDHALVNIFADSMLPLGEKADAVVSVFGSSTADGDVVDAVVSVFGDTRVTGTVGEAAVAVLGNVFVNGHVHGDVVAVLGDVELGPDAEVDGQIVCVVGTVKKDPGAILHQGIQNVGFGRSLAHRDGLKAWIHQCLLLGRPLAFGPNLGWAWGIAGVFLAFYVVLALLFRSGVEKCMQTLTARPGSSVLTAFLTVLISPVAMILLVMTGIGIFLVPFVGAALFSASLFGVVVVLAWLGLKFTRIFGDSPLGHPAFAVLIAGILVLGLYTVPFLGFFTFKLLGWLGMGVVLLTLLSATKSERPAPAFAAAAPVMPMTATGDVGGGGGGIGVVAPEAAGVPPAAPPLVVVPPVISAATLPRAGFWIRLAALLLDVVLLAIIASFLTGGGKLALFGVATYAAVLWKLKGTTIGGVICGLKVVRLDNRPIDWGTAIVRALGCFLSLVVVGLGFIWVAIDDQSQSWHDKIAGTTVVRVPKGVSLL